MKVCMISFKECWQDRSGKWFSSGGFPLQMAAIGALFDEMALLIVRGQPATGGLPLPEKAQIVPLPAPTGVDTRRKISVVSHFPAYVRLIARFARWADVVHTPLPGDIPLIGMMVAYFLGKRIIARYGGSWEETAQTTVMNRVTKALMRRLAGGKRVMLATGESQQPPAPGMHWLYATALSHSELENIHPSFDRGLSNPPCLAYVGRLSPEKGVRQLIEAMGYLKNESFQPLPRIQVIGDGPERANLESLTQRYGCEEAITFTGQIDREALSARLMDVDFCVQPSLTESLAKAWLDEMAHGLPVLASEVGTASTTIGRNVERGWLVPPDDSQALAKKLKEVLRGSFDWPALRQRCRAYVEGRTLEAWSEQIGRICARQWETSLVGGKLKA
jgi:glycosyltransferase involved in cell wall biosynthesis